MCAITNPSRSCNSRNAATFLRSGMHFAVRAARIVIGIHMHFWSELLCAGAAFGIVLVASDEIYWIAQDELTHALCSFLIFPSCFLRLADGTDELFHGVGVAAEYFLSVRGVHHQVGNRVTTRCQEFFCTRSILPREIDFYRNDVR